MKSIEIKISPKGETKVETKGFSGSDCQTATRSIEAALAQLPQQVFNNFFEVRQSGFLGWFGVGCFP